MNLLYIPYYNTILLMQIQVLYLNTTKYIPRIPRRESEGVSLKKNPALYLKLFTSTFYLSAFTFGGGYVIIPLMKKKFADDLHWIEEKEMLDLAAIAQSAPGPIAVNAAILIGYRIAGALGALTTILGTVLPPLIILSVISLFYQAFAANLWVAALLQGMQSGVAAVIADVVFSMASSIVKEKKWLPVLIMLGVFIANYFFGVNVILLILICGVIGAVSSYFESKSRKERGA